MNGKQSGKSHREAVREKARMLRKEQERRARRNKILIAVCVLFVLAVAGFALFVTLSSSSSAGKQGASAGSVRSTRLQNVSPKYGIAVDAQGAATASVRENIPQLAMYTDYMCIHCAELETSSKDAIVRHTHERTVQFINYPVAIMGHESSIMGAAASFYVATYAPKQYQKFQQGLFAKTKQFLEDRTGRPPTAADIAKIAKEAGVPQDVVNDLPASVGSGQWADVVKKATDSFTAAGFEGTPTVTLNGKEVKDYGKNGFSGYLDELAAKAK